MGAEQLKMKERAKQKYKQTILLELYKRMNRQKESLQDNATAILLVQENVI